MLLVNKIQYILGKLYIIYRSYLVWYVLRLVSSKLSGGKFTYSCMGVGNGVDEIPLHNVYIITVLYYI